MLKKMVVTLMIMICCGSSYAMDNTVQHIKDYYNDSAQSASAMVMRLQIMHLHEQGRVREAQSLAEQQLIWHQSNASFSSMKSKKKKR